MLEENKKFEQIITHLLNSEIEHTNDNKEHLEKASWLIIMILKDKFFDAKNDFIDVSENNDEHIVASLCESMRSTLNDCNNKEKVKKFIQEIVAIDHFKIKVNVRYEDITKIVFDSKSKISIDKLNERIEYFSMVVGFSVLGNKNKDELLKINKVLDKLFRHLKLAVFQKEYFMSSANLAETTATEAQRVAKIAENLANEADAQAKSTIANYISILGIFASIIFTLFGGVNLIGSTVKLLEVNSKWPYLTFIIALLMICLLTLLNMMVQWINSMSNLKKVLEKSNKEHKVPTVTWCWYKPWTWDFYTKAVSFFLVILLISLGGMYKVDRENLFSLTKETTTKNIPNPVTNKIINQSKVENKNKEITVVEKITLSNHTNGKGFDKDN
ncbi:hypothetical protein [Acinetobacter sp. FDAARGOS_724]|uniref:hypothetical protein n=1 Tax=Acinetobacter TaxID=469 RepID=UPI00158D35CF|nr:hypothetical protein [Acinetobacter sp. FDAARGOS_724]QKW82289.1 hypothetical protein FOC32_08325 [Acinetobacter sp. FDAARGOS_724]